MTVELGTGCPGAAGPPAGRAAASTSPTAPEARPLRILHLLSMAQRGGTERLVLLLAREQIRAGCHVEIAILNRGGPATSEFRAAGIAVHTLGLRAKVSPGAFLRLRRLIRRRGYQVVHTHLDLADLYGPFAAGHNGPVVVSTRHNTDPWRVRRSWKRPPFLLWERAAQRRADATIAVSGAVRDFLVSSEGLDPSGFVVIPNGIDLAPFRSLPGREDARAGMLRALGKEPGDPAAPGGADGGRTVAAFVGRLAEQKGIDLLLEAVARLDHRLDVVVMGEGSLRAGLEARAARGDLDGRVFFAGHREDVPELLPAFDLFVFPSRWEGFGLAAVEAMAAGLPVVAAESDGLREVVVDGECGLLHRPGDVDSLVAALEEIMRDPERGRRMGAAGRARAMERFGAGRMAAEVLSLYTALLPPAAPSREYDTEELRLTEAQIRKMWSGILPPDILRQEPSQFLEQQSRECGAVADHLERYLPLRNCRLLDLGCGLGSMLLEGHRRGASVFGLEPDAASLALSRHRLRKAGSGRGGLLAGVGEQLPLAGESLDAVVCCSVLEHVREPAAVLEEISRVLRPGGWLYLGVPNALNFRERHYKVFLPPRTPRFLARAWLRLRGRDPAFLDTLNEMTPRRVEGMLRQAGFEIVESPVGRQLHRLEELLSRRARSARPAARFLMAGARATRTGGLLRRLVRRGWTVQGALVARRPPRVEDR